MRLSDLLIVMLALGGLAACRDMDGEADAIDPPDRPAPFTATPDVTVPEATVRFETDNGEYVTGLVRMYREADGARGGEAARGFRLEVVLDGLPEGEYGWHIRRGSCGEPGPVAVALSTDGDRQGLAGPLVVRADEEPARMSTTVTDLTLDEARSGDYILHVSSPAADAPADGRAAADRVGDTAACAELSGDSNPTTM